MGLRYRVALIPLVALAGYIGTDDSSRTEAAENQRSVAGKTFAQNACATCHQISPEQPMPLPVLDWVESEYVQAPSFMAIALDPVKDAPYLRSAILLPHYPMKEQSITDENLDAVIAYILSLRRSQAP